MEVRSLPLQQYKASITGNVIEAFLFLVGDRFFSKFSTSIIIYKLPIHTTPRIYRCSYFFYCGYSVGLKIISPLVLIKPNGIHLVLTAVKKFLLRWVQRCCINWLQNPKVCYSASFLYIATHLKQKTSTKRSLKREIC